MYQAYAPSRVRTHYYACVNNQITINNETHYYNSICALAADACIFGGKSDPQPSLAQEKWRILQVSITTQPKTEGPVCISINNEISNINVRRWGVGGVRLEYI